MRRILLLASIALLWVSSAAAYTGCRGIWYNAAGQFPSTPVAGTQAGFDAAKTAVGQKGSIWLYPGCEGFISIGTLPDSVTVYLYDGGKWTVYSKGASFRDRAGTERLKVDSLGVSVTGKATVSDSLRTPRVMATNGIISRLGPQSSPTSGGAIRIVDGVTFPSTMAGIQSATTEIGAVGRGRLIVSPGLYTVDAVVELPSNITIDAYGAVFRRNASFLGVRVFTTGSDADSNVTIFGATFDNNSLAVTTEDIYLAAGSSNVTLRGCKWLNLSNRAAALIQAAGAGAAVSRSLHILDNDVLGGTTTDTYNSFQVFDWSDVDIAGNTIDGWGAIKVETSSSAPGTMRRVKVRGNTFRNVDQTNIFVRTNGTTKIEGVTVSGNVGTLSSMSVAKGMVNVGEQASGSGGVTSDVTVSSNVGRGYKGYFLNFGGGAGGGKIYNLTVTGNSFDGRYEDSLAINGVSESALISATVDSGFTFTGNSAMYTGRSGIRVSGNYGIIANNTLGYCAQNSLAAPTPVRESAIYVTQPALDITVSDNAIFNSHNAALAGSFDTGGITIDKDGAITRIRVLDNKIVDSRGASAGMKWGIKIGVSGATGNPDSTQLKHNEVSGAISGHWIKYGTGAFTYTGGGPINFAALGTPVNGASVYCTDCTKATPCAGAGTGAFAYRINGAWDCNP